MTSPVTETDAPAHRNAPTHDRTEAGTDTLRIGMFSESFAPVQNGVTTSLLTLVAGLREGGHHVCVFAPAHQNQRNPEPNVLRFPSFVTPMQPDYPLAYPFLPRIALTGQFDRLKLDVIHTHTPFVMGLTGARLAIQKELPLVSTFHTLYTQYTHYVPLLPDTLKLALLEQYLPWYYNRCMEIICPSRVAANYLWGQGVERPIAVIPTGIPLPSESTIGPEARAAARARLGIPQNAPVMFYAGRLAAEKNVEWLLDILEQVRARVPDARLVLAGGGPEAEELKQRAEEQFSTEVVMFLGPVPRREMDALFAMADVFCFPSPSETQGLVIGEARAAGTPCVVVDAGGAPETVTDGADGFRVPEGREEEFAARVVQILQEEGLRHTMSGRARANARNFTPDRMVEQVLAVYQRVRTEDGTLYPDGGEWEAVARTLQEQVESARR